MRTANAAGTTGNTGASRSNAPCCNLPCVIRHPKWALDNQSCRFSLDFPEHGLTLHGLTLRYDRNGEGFIAFPAFKGRDGDKWYNHYFIRFSDDMKKNIIARLEEL